LLFAQFPFLGHSFCKPLILDKMIYSFTDFPVLIKPTGAFREKNIIKPETIPRDHLGTETYPPTPRIPWSYEKFPVSNRRPRHFLVKSQQDQNWKNRPAICHDNRELVGPLACPNFGWGNSEMYSGASTDAIPDPDPPISLLYIKK